MLCCTVTRLASQTRRPDRVIVSAVSEADVAGLAAATGDPLEIIFADRGLPKQRNAGLRHLAGAVDIVVFFDDDFVPADDYLEVLERQFENRDNLVGATAVLLADGIKSSGIGFDDAVAIINAHQPSGVIYERKLPALYGCNLCIRLNAADGIWFDEALPLYQQAAQLTALNHDLAYGLGACYSAKQETAQALPYFKTAAALAPDAPATRFALGNELLQNGEPAAALPELPNFAVLGQPPLQAHGQFRVT